MYTDSFKNNKSFYIVTLLTLIFASILTFIINPKKLRRITDIKVVLYIILALILTIVLSVNHNNKIKREYEDADTLKISEKVKVDMDHIESKVVVQVLESKDEVNMYEEEFEMINIPHNAGDGWFKSYMDPIKITNKESKQYEYKSLYTEVNGLYMYKDMYVVAMTETDFEVGDEVRVIFDDGITINCFVGDVKNKRDPNFCEFGHIHYVGEEEHSSIVEFFVNTSTLEERSKKLGHVNNLISHGSVKMIYKKIKV